jgi:hypothetical protein
LAWSMTSNVNRRPPHLSGVRRRGHGTVALGRRQVTRPVATRPTPSPLTERADDAGPARWMATTFPRQ